MPKRILAALVLTFLATSANAATESFRCILTEVAVWPTRIHIQCRKSPSSAPSVIFFAVPTAANFTSIPNSSDNASRFLQVALAALKNPDAPLLVHFDPQDQSGASYGCAVVNCRFASAIFLQPEP